MKLRIFLPSLLCAVHLSAIEPARIVPSHVRVEGVAGVTKAATTDHFKTDYGSNDLHTTRQRTMTATARNLGKWTVDIETSVWWIGKPVGGGEREVLFEDWDIITILPNASKQWTSSSGTVKGRDMNLRAIGERITRGFKIDGWVVTLHEPLPPGNKGKHGRILAIHSSDGALADWLRQYLAPKIETAPADLALGERK
jgi:hypothetical protein